MTRWGICKAFGRFVCGLIFLSSLCIPTVAMSQMEAELWVHYYEEVWEGNSRSIVLRRRENVRRVYVPSANWQIFSDIIEQAYAAYSIVSPFLGPSRFAVSLLGEQGVAMLATYGQLNAPRVGAGLVTDLADMIGGNRYDRSGHAADFELNLDQASPQQRIVVLRWQVGAGDDIDTDWLENATVLPVPPINSPPLVQVSWLLPEELRWITSIGPQGGPYTGTGRNGGIRQIIVSGSDEHIVMRIVGPYHDDATGWWKIDTQLLPLRLPRCVSAGEEFGTPRNVVNHYPIPDNCSQEGTYPFLFAAKEEDCLSCLSSFMAVTVRIHNSCVNRGQGLAPNNGTCEVCTGEDVLDIVSGRCRPCPPGLTPDRVRDLVSCRIDDAPPDPRTKNCSLSVLGILDRPVNLVPPGTDEGQCTCVGTYDPDLILLAAQWQCPQCTSENQILLRGFCAICPSGTEPDETRTSCIGSVTSTGEIDEACNNHIQGRIAWDYQGNATWTTENIERLCAGSSNPTEPGNCFANVMHGDVDWGGGTRWNWRNALNLCAGTSNSQATIHCFQGEVSQGEDWGAAIQLCRSRPAVGVGDADSGVGSVFIPQQPFELPESQGSVGTVDVPTCKNTIQGQIAWNYLGNTQWSDANIISLCSDSPNPAEPGKCFNRVMHGGINWGGGTQWDWQNVISLCKGTDSADRTIECFQENIYRGMKWELAITQCN